MIIDATNLILGRMGTEVAKKALLGEKIDIVNCEKAVITGKKSVIFEEYKSLDDRGTTQWGPFMQKHPDRFVRRSIRGMLGYKKSRGREAYRRIMCYKGLPEMFAGKEIKTIESAKLVEKAGLKYLTVKQLTDLLKIKN